LAELTTASLDDSKSAMRASASRGRGRGFVSRASGKRGNDTLSTSVSRSGGDDNVYRVGINGFGHGRNILRAALHDKELDSWP